MQSALLVNMHFTERAGELESASENGGHLILNYYLLATKFD